MRVEEHFFVIALGKAMDWLSELKQLKPATAPRIDAFLQSLPHAVDVRNMREHDIEYFKGKGRNQERFMHSHTDSTGQVLGEADASSTAVYGDEYMIGGRLNVRRTIELCEALMPDVFVPPPWAI